MENWQRRIEIKPSKKYKKVDESVYKIDVFYNRSIRLWTMIPVNKDGFQLYEAEYMPNRKAMERNLKDLNKQYSIK